MSGTLSNQVGPLVPLTFVLSYFTMLNTITDHLGKILKDYSGRLAAVPEEVFTHKPLPEKWSRKEILGHLVDSAQNNIRRFVVAQYEDDPVIGYNQDSWVTVAGYNS